jgi:hypothetical protein
MATKGSLDIYNAALERKRNEGLKGPSDIFNSAYARKHGINQPDTQRASSVLQSNVFRSPMPPRYSSLYRPETPQERLARLGSQNATWTPGKKESAFRKFWNSATDKSYVLRELSEDLFGLSEGDIQFAEHSPTYTPADQIKNEGLAGWLLGGADRYGRVTARGTRQAIEGDYYALVAKGSGTKAERERALAVATDRNLQKKKSMTDYESILNARNSNIERTPEEKHTLRWREAGGMVSGLLDTADFAFFGATKAGTTGFKSLAKTIAKTDNSTEIYRLLVKRYGAGLPDDVTRASSKAFKYLNNVDDVTAALNRLDLQVQKGFVPKGKVGAANSTAAPSTSAVSKTPTTPLTVTKAKASGMSFDEWVKGQGETVYRGGKGITPEKIKDAGISVSKGRNVAEDFVKQKGGKVEDIIISKNANVIDYKDVPDVKYKELDDYSPSLDKGDKQIWRDLEVEYQKAVNWARENGYDAVKLPLEGETRIINPDVVKTRSQLKAEWDSAPTTTLFTRTQDIAELNPRMFDDATGEANTARNFMAKQKKRDARQPSREAKARLAQTQGEQSKKAPSQAQGVQTVQGRTKSSVPTRESYKEVYDKNVDKATRKAVATGKLSPTNPNQPAQSGAYRNLKKGMGEAWIGLRELVEDDMVRVKKLLQDKNVNVSDASDVYQAEILFHGRVGARLEEVSKTTNDIDRRILSVEKKHNIKGGVVQKQVNDYLIARHAPERNAALGDGAAGIKTHEAKARLAELEALPHGKDVRRIADEIQEMNNKTLDILLDGEVISKELYDTLRTKYRHHVPLYRYRLLDDGTDEVGDVLGRGFGTKGTGIKRAKGSDKEVLDVFGNVTFNYKQALIRAEENRVGLSTLQLARDNPDLGLFQIIKPKPIGKTFDDTGVVMEKITDPQVLTVRKDGKPVYIKINDERMAAAFQGMNREDIPSVLKPVATLTRFYAGLQTRFNPEFAFSNKVRDLQEVAVYLASKEGVGASGAAKAMTKDIGSTRAVLDSLRGIDSEGAKLYRQMRLDGGTTGGLGLSTRSQVDLDIDAIRKTNRSNPRKAAKMFVDGVDNWNTIFEDSSRLSVYTQALEQGLTRKRAAVLAKEASVNFNKAGRGGPLINALYMFSNASIQGSAKMLRAMKKPKAAAWVIGTIGTTVFALNKWNDSVDEDWRNKVTKWDRMSSMVLVLPTSEGVRYVTMPVSWGIKPMKVAMDYAYDAASGHLTSVGDVLGGFLASVIEGYNPVGGTDLTSALTPTALDAISEIRANKAWHGGKIRPDWNRNAPNSIQYFDDLGESTTGRALIGITNGLSSLGVEISPQTLNYALEQAVGGAGRTAKSTFNLGAGLLQGELPPPKDTPVIRRFYKTRDNEQIGSGASEYDTLRGILENQARDRFVAQQEAEKAYNQFKKLPREEAAERFGQLIETDPDLAKKVNEIIEKEKLNLNYTERMMGQLGVENGERATYIAEKFNSLETKEEKAALWSEYVEKKLITKAVAAQLMELLRE